MQQTIHWLVTIGMLALTLPAGCTSPAVELEPFVEAVQRIPLGADDGVARFFLGFPTKVSANQRTWWYLRPEPHGPAATTGGLSVLIRLDPHNKVVERELIEWASLGKGRYRLQSERLIVGTEKPDEAEFAAVLGEKLLELGRAADRYRFSSQERSYQLLLDNVLLLSADRWTRPGSQLVGVRGEVDTTQSPQVAQAVREAWQVRLFAIELDFDRGGR